MSAARGIVHIMSNSSFCYDLTQLTLSRQTSRWTEEYQFVFLVYLEYFGERVLHAIVFVI